MTIGRTRMGPQSKGYLHTTDATADQAVVTCDIPFKHSATVAVYITAIADTGDYLFESSVHSVTRDGATASYVGEVSNKTASSGAGAWVTTIDCTGTTLRVRFTGEAAHVVEVTAVAVFETSAVNVPIVWECATTDATQDIAIVVAPGTDWWVDWGDGSFSTGTGTGGVQNAVHNYAAAGCYAIRWTIGDKASLWGVNATSADMRGALPAFDWSACGTVMLAGGQLTGAIPSITALPISTLHAYDHRLTGYTASVIAAACASFIVDNNLLPQSAIDQILADFETGVAGRPGAGTISLGGTGNAAPSAAGLASKAAILAAKPGWVITHN